MILTVTLNPAIDKTYRTTNMIIGQVNRMQSSVSLAGGKGINVARILRQFSMGTMATGFLGGYSGAFIADYLLAQGVDCQFIRIREETRSNMNIISEDGYVTELLEPGPTVSETELTEFLEKFRELCRLSRLVILSGSAAKGLPSDIYRTLIRIADREQKKVLLDTSGEQLAEGIKGVPYLIKPNNKELEFVMGQRLDSMEQYIQAAQMLQRDGIKNIVISMGSKGLLWANEKGVLRAVPPKIKALNTVGCGDSVVASLAVSYCKGEAKEESLRKAAALSAANALTIESGQIPMERYEEMLSEIVIEQLR